MLVASLFVDLGRGKAKHGFVFDRAALVPAPYLLYCSPAACSSFAKARAKGGIHPSMLRTVPWSMDATAEGLAKAINVSTDALWHAARRSVAPVHCPSAEIVLVWLAKLLVVRNALEERPEVDAVAWVDAGFNVYGSLLRRKPPPAPWLSFWPANDTLAVRRMPDACHNSLRGADYASCVVGTYFWGSRRAWARFLPLYFARLHELVLSANSTSRRMLCADRAPPCVEQKPAQTAPRPHPPPQRATGHARQRAHRACGSRPQRTLWRM